MNTWTFIFLCTMDPPVNSLGKNGLLCRALHPIGCHPKPHDCWMRLIQCQVSALMEVFRCDLSSSSSTNHKPHPLRHLRLIIGDTSLIHSLTLLCCTFPQGVEEAKTAVHNDRVDTCRFEDNAFCSILWGLFLSLLSLQQCKYVFVNIQTT
jgi:hypothetical protein